MIAALSCIFAHGPMPTNPELGVPGFPDCSQPGPITDDVNANAHSLVCAQKKRDSADQIAIGCIGDSITAVINVEQSLLFFAFLLFY
jgi:hypothetical protein